MFEYSAICGYIYHKSKEANNKLAQCLAKLCMCCLCLFEKCLRYFNATSYAMIAITGHGYCVSACKGKDFFVHEKSVDLFVRSRVL